MVLGPEEPHNDLEDAKERYITNKRLQEEELVFRHVFARSDTTYDTDALVLNNIRDLVLYFMHREFLTYKFVYFMHHRVEYQLLHSLTIYFEYFLQMVEFVMIHRDELSGSMAQIQSEQTNDEAGVLHVSRPISDSGGPQLQHNQGGRRLRHPIWDKNFREQFLACSNQIVWIAMHRRAYNIIEMEMNRFFSSEHFVTALMEYPIFTTVEKSRNKIVNYLMQVSELIQEMQDPKEEDLPILSIGDRKYRGTDIRIMEMEMEYIVPSPQLRLIDLDWPAVLCSNFSLKHDPYLIVRQPRLAIPKMDVTMRRLMAKIYGTFFKINEIYDLPPMH
ncbi:Hypothetical predicted protein [Drosophila guanche]|uniref:Protein phosphatase 1 regulatory subunit 36 n=1 Tax=Drosophila guanche TaxID=7266 RepID=A0A3B0JNJ1_DROGU|nr:Hypothetical predicted protein [Drosophila guanche]